MAMKHIAGMAGLPGAKPITEQHKFQLIYSREPAEINTQSLEFGEGKMCSFIYSNIRPLSSLPLFLIKNQ